MIAQEYAQYYTNSILQEKWTKESALELFHYFYKSYNDLIFVAYDDHYPVGIIASALKPWWDGFHLEDGEIFVSDKYRGMGIAKALFKTLFEYAYEKYNATIFEAHTYEGENRYPYCWYEKLGCHKEKELFIINGNIKEMMEKL